MPWSSRWAASWLRTPPVKAKRSVARRPAGLRHRYTPRRPWGSKCQAVSSRTSRTTAASRVSPRSTCPAGWLKTRRRLMRSSTIRKRPAVSATAATVMSGARLMRAIVPAGGKPAPSRSAATGGAQAVLGCAGVPHLIKLLKVQTRGSLVVDVGDTVPGVGAHAVDDGTIVSDEIGRGALRRLGGHVTDVDAARQAPAHGHEAVAVAHDAHRLGQQYAHLGEAAREYEVLDHLEEGALIVEVRFEVGRIDGDESLCGGGDLVDRSAHLGE